MLEERLFITLEEPCHDAKPKFWEYFFLATKTLKIMHLVLECFLPSSSSNMKNGNKVCSCASSSTFELYLCLSCLSRRLGLNHSFDTDYV